MLRGRALNQRCLSSGAAGLAKLTEGSLHLRGKIAVSFAIPAEMRLIEGRAVERGDKIAARRITAIRLSLRQLFAQGRHPAAQGAQETPAQIGLFKHQSQHFFGVPRLLHLLPHDRQDCILKGGERLPGLWRLGKALRHPLTEMLHAEGEQLLFGAEIAEEGASRDSRIAANLFYCRAVETDRSKQLPRSPFDLPKHELMFPFAKRPGILRIRPLFADSRANRFLHCMQIMAQSAVL